MKPKHIIHLAGGIEQLTRCGAEGNIHIVGPGKIDKVTCERCRDWYYDMRLRLTAMAFMTRGKRS